LAAIRIRTIVQIVFWPLATFWAISMIFPRIHNDETCESDVPNSSAESLAMVDTRQRMHAACSRPATLCRLRIDDARADRPFGKDGLIRISAQFVRKDFFDGCLFEHQHHEIFVYGRDGRFVTIEAAPYGIRYR
jgi:hypothetical protein